MAVDLGPLDRRVAFQRAVAVTDTLNEPVPASWSTLATVMATRTPTSDGERVAGAQVQRVVTDRFVTHWGAQLAAVTGADQLLIVQDGREVVFDIVGVKELGFREGLEFSAMARPDLEAAA